MESPDTGPVSDRDQTETNPSEPNSATGHGDSQNGVSLRRRDTLLSMLGVAGLGLLGSQPVSAQEGPPPRRWNTDVDAQGHRLSNLGALTMDENQTELADFEGTGLSIDGSGVLNVTITDTDTHTLVSDSDGTPSDAEAADVEFGTNLDLTGSGGAFTVDSLAEANTGSNIGSGTGVFAGKTGANLEFRTLTAGSNVSLTATSDEIELTATDTDTDTRTDVSDDGTVVVTDTAAIDFGSGLEASDDGDGSATVELRDDLDGSTGAVAATLSRSQRVSAGDTERIEFEQTSVDVRDEFDASSHEFVADQDGIYHVDVDVQAVKNGVASSAGFSMTLQKVTSGTRRAQGSTSISLGSGSQGPMSISRVLQLQEDDLLYVSLHARRVDAIIDDRETSVFSIHQID